MLPSGVIDQKYRIVQKLGAGGMGTVYEARHLATGRRVAVKVIGHDSLRAMDPVRARFEREARAVGVLESPHIVQVLDAGVDAGTRHPYMVMEYLSGEDLQRAMRRLGPLPSDLALRVAAQACFGLRKAHDAGIIHRDIKPANLFLTSQDDGAIVVKLLDFGIAKVNEDAAKGGAGALTATGAMVGSPHYVSPEQAIGAKAIDHRTDIWSLGVVLYEALSGKTPFAEHGALGSLLVAIYSEPPPPLHRRAPWVGGEVAALVHRALSPDPGQRFQTASEMLAAIQAFLPHGHAIHESMLAPSERGRTEIVPASDPRSPAPATSAMPARLHPFADRVPQTTGSGVEAPLARQLGRARSTRRLVASLAVAIAALLGLGGVLLSRGHANASDAGAPAAAASSLDAPGATSLQPFTAARTATATVPDPRSPAAEGVPLVDAASPAAPTIPVTPASDHPRRGPSRPALPPPTPRSAATPTPSAPPASASPGPPPSAPAAPPNTTDVF